MIVGKIYFLLVRIKIKHMELSIIRRETTGAVPNQYNESETITKFEIMDGAPVRGVYSWLTKLISSSFGVLYLTCVNVRANLFIRRNDTDTSIPGRI